MSIRISSKLLYTILLCAHGFNQELSSCYDLLCFKSGELAPTGQHLSSVKLSWQFIFWLRPQGLCYHHIIIMVIYKAYIVYTLRSMEFSSCFIYCSNTTDYCPLFVKRTGRNRGQRSCTAYTRSTSITRELDNAQIWECFSGKSIWDIWNAARGSWTVWPHFNIRCYAW